VGSAPSDDFVGRLNCLHLVHLRLSFGESKERKQRARLVIGMLVYRNGGRPRVLISRLIVIGHFPVGYLVDCSSCVESFSNHIGTAFWANPYFMALVGVDVKPVTHMTLLFLRVRIVGICEG